MTLKKRKQLPTYKAVPKIEVYKPTFDFVDVLACLQCDACTVKSKVDTCIVKPLVFV